MSQTGLFQDLAFATSVVDEVGLPSSRGEVAIAGRSNAGKSSAINALAQRHRMAFVSKTPGRTQQLNFFSLGEERYLVDLPGYGYAKVPSGMRNEWKEMISGYLQFRPQLLGLVVVMDVRHPMKDLDVQLLDWFASTRKPAHVLLTKADKLGKQAGTDQLRATTRILAAEFPHVTAQLFSSQTRAGVPEAEAVMRRWFEAA